MSMANVTPLHERYTDLSDRFRSLWTFYQFLGGLFKYQGLGPLPFDFDFQAFHQRLQDLVPQIGDTSSMEPVRTMDAMERELKTVHGRLRKIEEEFPPSLMRRLFDHLKRQDEKILFALTKFYLQYDELDADTLDKLDILLTRIGEAPQDNGSPMPRDREELLEIYSRLAAFARVPKADTVELSALITAVKEFRSQVEAMTDFESILTSEIYDRFRKLKHNLGWTFVQPELLVEIVITNILAKRRFQELYQEEEARILEDTNRIFEVERYLEKNPNVAHEELREQIETFRRFRSRFDAGRRENNLKREDILELRRAMAAILERVGPLGENMTGSLGRAPERAPGAADAVVSMPGVDEPAGATPRAVPKLGSSRAAQPRPVAAFPAASQEPQTEEIELENGSASLAQMLPPDPMLNEALHKIMFALELVDWEVPAEHAARAKEVYNLRLEPWEVEAYRKLSSGSLVEGSLEWELQRFYLMAAALRVKMDEEALEIERLEASRNEDRLSSYLEHSAQSLERAREFDRRFRWFIEDMLYRGKTEGLEQIQRTHFRFLQSFSTLWLRHESAGGITPL